MTVSAAEKKRQDQRHAVEVLRDYLQPGDTVWTINRHTARSGMMRAIDAYKIEDGDRVWLSRFAATATGYSFSERYEAVRMDGCGMDMGFALVYAISRAIFPDGFGCIGEGCPSNDHSNGDRDYTPHNLRVNAASGENADHWHNDGGYALNQRWL